VLCKIVRAGPWGSATPIAATAIVHRLTVATRNIADFRPMGVALLNP
jgi:predicted nucleic acid-binding protein